MCLCCRYSCCQILFVSCVWGLLVVVLGRVRYVVGVVPVVSVVMHVISGVC